MKKIKSYKIKEELIESLIQLGKLEGVTTNGLVSDSIEFALNHPDFLKRCGECNEPLYFPHAVPLVYFVAEGECPSCDTPYSFHEPSRVEYDKEIERKLEVSQNRIQIFKGGKLTKEGKGFLKKKS